MGGQALNVFTKRCTRNEFHILADELVTQLNKHFDRVAIPTFYRTKESFGDIDIIVCNDGKFNIRTYIEDNFNPQEIFHNGNCWSFDFKETQVDLISVSSEHFESMCNYMGNSDLGNYIGRIAHALGMKFGQEGFWYEHYFKGKNLGKIMISKDIQEILEFLGLSYDIWLEGFDTLEDIFKYISECKYFNWKMFQLNQLNKINRDRNAKRKSYMSFLEWIDKNVADEEHEFEPPEDKSEYLNKAMEVFDGNQIELEIRKLEYLHCEKLYIQAKFSGGEIMKRYGFEGKELGNRIKGFKDWINSIDIEDFDNYVLRTPSILIYADFELFLNKHYENK